jgi:hypothetical protein
MGVELGAKRLGLLRELACWLIQPIRTRKPATTAAFQRRDTWLQPYLFVNGQILFPCIAGPKPGQEQL